LYCHSSQREKKEQGIQEVFAKRFEASLEKLASGLHKKGTVKHYDKVLERLGRLKQKYSRAAQHYEVSAEHDETTGKASTIHWRRIKSIEETLPGVYCLRTNQDQWDEATLWYTYTLLTDLGGGVSQSQIGAGLTSCISPQNRTRQRPSVYLGVGLSSRAHNSCSTQSLRHSSQLGRCAPRAPRAGPRDGRTQARRRKNPSHPQSHPPRTSSLGHLRRYRYRVPPRKNRENGDLIPLYRATV
jgi:hypothetical protein